ncbi:MAG: ABC transporter transmembrane domain-containing protein, partial [Acutalibacteraceae bacterium]
MIKRLSKSIREYKKVSVITPILMIGEVLMEAIIPYILAILVNNIQGGCDLRTIAKYGVVLIALAFVSLSCGGVAGYTASKASAGFAKNLRRDLFSSIQNFSFANIDRFSSSSLVTRMTTDVNNVQMAYMMMIRIAVRAPLTFLFSIIMAYIMGGSLATLFVVV